MNLFSSHTQTYPVAMVSLQTSGINSPTGDGWCPLTPHGDIWSRRNCCIFEVHTLNWTDTRGRSVPAFLLHFIAFANAVMGHSCCLQDFSHMYITQKTKVHLVRLIIKTCFCVLAHSLCENMNRLLQLHCEIKTFCKTKETLWWLLNTVTQNRGKYYASL